MHSAPTLAEVSLRLSNFPLAHCWVVRLPEPQCHHLHQGVEAFAWLGLCFWKTSLTPKSFVSPTVFSSYFPVCPPPPSPTAFRVL